jgi:hypothetical protein
MDHDRHASQAFGVQRARRPASALTRIARRLKGDPSTTASNATQHGVRAAMHVPVALSFLLLAHPAHDPLLERWLPGVTYLLGSLVLAARAWRARAARAAS